jgi:hypothetical protein
MRCSFWPRFCSGTPARKVRPFGEEPGRLLAVGVLTDTDNTGGHAEAWYGDIRFVPAAR